MQPTTPFEKETMTYNKLLNPFGNPAVQVILAPTVTPTSMRVDIESLSADATVLALVNFENKKIGLHQSYKAKTTVWGFISLNEIRKEAQIVVGVDKKKSLVIDKAFMKSYLPMTVSVLTPIHSSFKFYQNLSDMLIGEESFEQLNICILNRLNIFRKSLKVKSEKDTWIDELSTSENVRNDYIGYAGMLLSLFGAPHKHGELRSPLLSVLRRLESKLARIRLLNCSSATLFEGPCKELGVRKYTASNLKGTKLWERLQEHDPLVNTFYSCDFEHAAELISKRTCYIREGRVFFSSCDLPLIAVKQVMLTFDRDIERARVGVSDAVKSNPRMRRLMSKVVTELQGFKERFDGGGVNHIKPCNKAVPLEIVIESAPPCIYRLATLASVNEGVTDHLKNKDRLIYAQHLMMLGWNEKMIQNYWRPKIQISYDGSTEVAAVEKEVSSTVKWLKDNRGGCAYRCSHMMEKRMCPLSESSGSAMKAHQTCGQNLKERLHLNIVPDFQSPIHFARIAIENKLIQN